MLCHFAQQFPHFVSDFLESGASLQRRFREESVTDMLMSNLVILGGGRVFVDFPNETATGADMQWDFVNQTSGKFFRVLIQAKQAYGEGKIWRRHSYKELFKKDSSGVLQADVLARTAQSSPSTYPLYAFYHRAALCTLARSAVPNITGVNLADGFHIASLVRNASTSSLRIQNKSVGKISAQFFLLAELFCPSIPATVGPFAFSSKHTGLLRLMVEGALRGVFMPTRPEEVRERLIGVRNRSASELGLADIPSVPELSSEIPPDTRRLIETAGQPSHRGGNGPRWHIVFVSESPSHQQEKVPQFQE
jgi:hypothetical protein